MKKNILLLLSLCTISALSVVLFSCGDDDPPAKGQLSFATATTTVVESDGTVEVEITLNKAASEDFTIEYTLDGSAIEKSTVSANAAYDYEDLNEGEIEIKKGEKSAIIEFTLYSDGAIEDPETIEISIADVDSEKIEITRDDEFEITITQEDGILIGLEWGVGEGENYTDVDMDMILWAEDESSNLALTNIAAARLSVNSPEALFLPSAFLQDGNYGLSCIYYAGTPNPMNFKVTFIEIVNDAEASTTVRTGAYGPVNINNTWDAEDGQGAEPLLAITFKKSGGDYHDFSFITVHANGSRQGSFNTHPPFAKKVSAAPVMSSRLQRILKRLK